MSVKEWCSSSQFSTDQFCCFTQFRFLSLINMYFVFDDTLIFLLISWLMDRKMDWWIDWFDLCEIPAITFVIIIFLYTIAQYYMWCVCYTCIHLYWNVDDPM